MKQTIFLKILAGFVVVILLGTLPIVLTSFASMRRSVEISTSKHLESLGRTLQAEVEARLDAGDEHGLDVWFKALGPTIGARLTVIDPSGRVLADSEKDPAVMEDHRYRQEVAEALQGRVAESLRFSYTVEARMLYIGMPLVKGGSVRAVLRLSQYMRGIDEFISHNRVATFRAALAVIALTLVGAVLLSLHFAKPVARLRLAADRVAGGDFSVRVKVRQRDELGALAADFNLMTERLTALFADATRQQDNLVRTIGAIQEGLAVLDKDGRIILANDAFRTMTREAGAEGKFFWEILRRPALRELVALVRAERGVLRRELRLDERSYLCTLSYLPHQDGVVLLLQDLTELRRVEDIKKDFVINASHELRTPIAAVLGAAELLEIDPSPARDAAALEILKRNAGRLGGIVDDLLKLGELEAPSFRLDLKPLTGPELAARVVPIYQARAAAKGLELRVESAPGLPPFTADSDLLERMLHNLIDNAVKYTDRGRVVLSFRREGGDTLIEVSDTGPGIPPENQARVFERFYVVDKSRSRKLGGTGLGLAIVKHVVQLHGGTITLRSEEGKGTTFTVRLPAEPAAPAQS
ncbi:MAG: ATP-binding protein [Candidatus Aminicenantes bacterium]|nr:ATP-binding protein [Candidatus Aminicenantes bacterium]